MASIVFVIFKEIPSYLNLSFIFPYDLFRSSGDVSTVSLCGAGDKDKCSLLFFISADFGTVYYCLSFIILSFISSDYLIRAFMSVVPYLFPFDPTGGNFPCFIIRFLKSS